MSIASIAENYLKTHHKLEFQRLVDLANYQTIDTKHINEIYQTLVDETTDPKAKEFYFGILTMIYHPIWFEDVIKLKIGLRQMFSDAAGFNNPEMVNAYTEILRPRMKGERFATLVKNEANRFIEHYTNLK
ncbi:hypothetical protein ACVWYG_000727 [Pedobacter sp. UYEF25]